MDLRIWREAKTIMSDKPKLTGETYKEDLKQFMIDNILNIETMSDEPKLTEENFKEDLKQFIVNKILSTEKFNACFEGIPISESRLLRIKNLIDESVINEFLEDFSQTCVEAKIAMKFEILNSLKPMPELSWRPPGDPMIQLRSVRVDCKRRQLEELRILVKVVSERISKLKQLVDPFLELQDSIFMKQEEIEKITSSAQTVASNNKELLEEVYSDLAESFELLYGYK